MTTKGVLTDGTGSQLQNGAHVEGGGGGGCVLCGLVGGWGMTVLYLQQQYLWISLVCCRQPSPAITSHVSRYLSGDSED